MIPPEPDVSALTNYQSEIYRQGLSGVRPPPPTDLTRLEGLARDKLDDGPFGFVAGGAGSGATLRANREAMDRWRIVPRMLRETSHRRLSCNVLGTRHPAGDRGRCGRAPTSTASALSWTSPSGWRASPTLPSSPRTRWSVPPADRGAATPNCDSAVSPM